MNLRLTGACLLLLTLVASSCGEKKTAEQDNQEPAQLETASDVPSIVLDMIEAHGGMVNWRNASTVSFEDEFSTPGGPATVSRVMVDQRTRRAYIDFPGTDMSIAWDGRKAWGVNWTAPYPPRFLALLNYYFVNLPWLALDPGVNLAQKGTGVLAVDSSQCEIVMMTFAPGTGDTPDDYYRLYIDPVTKRLKACDYVVTYRALLPEGVKSTPEHTLVYESFETVNGLHVPTAYTIYEQGMVYATCRIRDWKFGAAFEESRMAMPDSAVVDTTRPR